tara:strand:- start:58885 stop:59745 length:861 start_codon:yes stop_codon:yes gene_type:complete
MKKGGIVCIVSVVLLSFGIYNPVFSVKSKSSISNNNRSISKPLANVKWHWMDDFNPSEVTQIKRWLATVNKAVFQTLGQYPFDLHYYIHRSQRGEEPVPWAHTTRGSKQGVHFHINMNYSLEEFLADWTAQHEISHLSIPFVGSENAWFSEGYATYMQNQVMQSQGIYTEAQVAEKYAERVGKCKSSYQTQLPFPLAADSLKKAWNYPDLYWGGVSFFWKLDKEYQKQYGKTLNEVITKFTAKGRVNDTTPKNFCKELDTITNTTLASDLLVQYNTQPAYLIFEDM